MDAERHNMDSFFISKASLPIIAVLLVSALFFRWQRDIAREDAEEWALKARHAEASLEAVQAERAAILASLETRNATLNTIQQERRATASKLSEANKNVQTRSWYDTPLPADIRRVLIPTANSPR